MINRRASALIMIVGLLVGARVLAEAAEAVVLAADEGRFNVLSRIDMEDKPIQASIAIAEGRLFIRTANKLFCIAN